MSVKISKKIVGFSVANKNDVKESTTEPVQSSLPLGLEMNETLERPETLIGSTYKVKTPLSEHAMYITVNDIILNKGTVNEERRPFEIFINSKNMDHFQWIVALTRIISAVFRKGGDITFLTEELGSVFDPKGGYFKSGGKYMPSLVAEIGDVLQIHLETIGLMKKCGLDDAQQKLIAQKRAEFEKMTGDEVESAFPKESVLCTKCSVKAVVMMDNCLTCLNCGDSKCG